MEQLLRRIELHLERLQIAEYLERQRSIKRGLLVSFGIGVMRGLGFAFGFSVLGAIAIALLRMVVLENLPGIGSFLAEIIRAAETRM